MKNIVIKYCEKSISILNKLEIPYTIVAINETNNTNKVFNAIQFSLDDEKEINKILNTLN